MSPRIFILTLINCVINCLCFHVSFDQFYDAKLEPFNMQMQKREMAQFFDKAAYSFNGLEKVESVPVPFPLDICILSLDGVKYAASLHKNKIGERHFTVYKNVKQSYIEIYTTATPNAIAMDCKTLGAKGYIALAFNLTQPIDNARDGSPIYQLSADDDRLRAVQFFPTTNLYAIYMRPTANDLYMLQTFQRNANGNGNGISASNQQCPYYKLAGASFTLVGRIACSNARHVEPFSINYENYVALANYADVNGHTTTYSEIYKFVGEQKGFQLIQKIRTYGAVDVRHFRVPVDEVKRQHFLVFANTMRSSENGVANGEDADEAESVFYVFDKGQFLPYQSLSLYAVEQFLPVQNNVDAEKFLLLVAAKDQDIKMYNLNDWKFEPSNVQFTEGALGQGVSKMRIYQENDKNYLVIANEKMTENDTNIFLPIYKQDEHANALRQQIIDWTKAQIERLAQIDVDQLQREVEAKLAKNPQPKINMQVKEIPQANIQTVHTQSFISPQHNFSSYYWQALHYATKAVNALEAEIKAANPQRLRRDAKNANNTSNTSNANANNSNFKTTTNQTANDSTIKTIAKFEKIKVNTLVIKEQLNAQKVNGIDAANPTFEHIKADRVSVKENLQLHAPTLSLKHLQINGTLNKHTWQDLQNQTLKRAGVQQVIHQPVEIGSLFAGSVQVRNNEIDGNNLNRLVLIDGGGGSNNANTNRTYVINQALRFEAPVKAKELVIHERLNQILVEKDKLNVLLKRTNETQKVEGAKRFESVRILQPIEMEGQILGNRLQSMAPQQIIHDDLILNGDFIINSDAIIYKSLNVDDLVDLNTQKSTKQILQNGLDMTKTLEDVNIRFEEPLEANNTELSFINGIDMQQLIKTNYKHIQVIGGEKHFKQTLAVQSGFSEVKYLNGIDVDTLPERLLLKSANQTIKVPMEVREIRARNIKADNITLQGKTLDEYVTRTADQSMPITLTVNELHASTFNVEKLQANSESIFGKSMIGARSVQTPLVVHNATNTTESIINDDMLLAAEGNKFANTLYVGNIRLNDNATINGRNIHDIVNQLKQLSADIHFKGNYKFNYDMNIGHLKYRGTFNDIPAEQFGHSWLQKNGTQVFTSPQTLLKVNCLKGVQLDGGSGSSGGGTLNGHAIEDFYEKTYWINRNEYIDAMEFTNPIEMQESLSTATLNGIQVPQDTLDSNSTEPQIIYAGATIHGHLNISHTNDIRNVATLNGIPLLELERYLNAGNADDSLHVEHAKFGQTPLYQTLNRYKIATLLDSVWLANENVNLRHHIDLANATFNGLLELEGLVNNVDLQYLKTNYFSLTRSQEIATELILTAGAKFKGDLTASDAHLSGLLVDINSNATTDFNEFVGNTLKTYGPHEVRAPWSIARAHVQGDLDNVQINNLNLVNDVIRLDIPCAPIIAPKRLTNTSTIQKLYITPGSTISGVHVVDWMQNAVHVLGNQSINGNITIDTIQMYNDLTVLGAVNNISNFVENALLLRNVPQTVQGNIYVNNLFVDERRILVNNIENLFAKNVNQQNADEFYQRLAKISPTLNVEGNLIFMQPVHVKNYRTKSATAGERSVGNSKVVEEFSDIRNMAENFNWQKMLEIVQQLKKSLQEPHYVLSHFAVRQKLEINASKIVQFKIDDKNGETMDAIGIVNYDNNMEILYYQWSAEIAQFTPVEDLAWLPNQKAVIDVLALLSRDNPLAIEMNETVAHLLPQLTSTLSTKLSNLQTHKSFTIDGEHCFIKKPATATNSTQIYCVKNDFAVYIKYELPKKNIREVHQLASDKMALLTPNGIEIIRMNTSMQLLQRISAHNVTKWTVTEKEDITYLAIHIAKATESLRCGSIKLYRSLNSTYFDHIQNLDCLDPIQMSFIQIPLTGDLLLHMLIQNSAEAPLIVYQFKGVIGFERIIGATTLPAARAYQSLQLESDAKQIIALMHDGEVQFVEIVLKIF